MTSRRDPRPSPPPSCEWSRRGEGRVRAALRGDVRGGRAGGASPTSTATSRGSAAGSATPTRSRCTRPARTPCSSRMHEMRDPFPAPVLPLAQFPRLAPSLGITDLYGVFPASWRAPRLRGADWSLRDRTRPLGRAPARGHPHPRRPLPGGGFVARGSEARRLVEAADQVFSWMPAVLEHVPGVTPIDPGVIDTAFYARTERDFAAPAARADVRRRREAAQGPRVALAAMAELAGEPVHLHVVGPHDAARRRCPPTARRSTAGSTARGCASCTAAATSSSSR